MNYPKPPSLPDDGTPEFDNIHLQLDVLLQKKFGKGEYLGEQADERAYIGYYNTSADNEKMPDQSVMVGVIPGVYRYRGTHVANVAAVQVKMQDGDEELIARIFYGNADWDAENAHPMQMSDEWRNAKSKVPLVSFAAEVNKD